LLNIFKKRKRVRKGEERGKGIQRRMVGGCNYFICFYAVKLCIW
jgi:hypothetical protein